MPVTARANGNIAAWQEASVGTEANGLRLADVRVNVGDVVKRGQVLATFAPETMQADLLQTRAAVAEAEATLADAAANAERAQEPARDRRAERSDDQPVRHRRAHRAGPPRRAARRAAGAPAQGRRRRAVRRARRRRHLGAQRHRRRRAAGRPGAVPPDPPAAGSSGAPRWRRRSWRRSSRARASTVTPAGGAPIAGTVRMVAPTVDPQTRNGIVYVDLPVARQRRAPACSRAASSTSAARAALTLPQSAVQLRDGFSYVLQGRRRQQGDAELKVDVGRRVGDRIEVTGGLGADARVVATGGGFLADGDTVRVVDAPAAMARARRRPRGRRRPSHDERLRPGRSATRSPAVLLFIMLTLVGADELSGDEDPELPGHRPADRHRHGVAAGRVAGAARDRRRAQDRELDRHAAGRQAHLHHGAGRPSTTTVEFRLEKPTQEAVDDVRDAVSRVRSDLPADLRDPIIAKIDLAGSPILTYTVASSRMDDEALSWFVDDTVTRSAARGARRRRGDARRRRRRARSASSSTRRACWR